MSRYFDLSQNAVLFVDCMLPMEAFMTTRDTIEMKLVSQIFDFAKGLAEWRLSDVAMALFSAYILLQPGTYKATEILLSTANLQFPLPDRQGLQHAEAVRQLKQAVVEALDRELTKNPPSVPTKGDVPILTRLMNKSIALK